MVKRKKTEPEINPEDTIKSEYDTTPRPPGPTLVTEVVEIVEEYTVENNSENAKTEDKKPVSEPVESFTKPASQPEPKPNPVVEDTTPPVASPATVADKPTPIVEKQNPSPEMDNIPPEFRREEHLHEHLTGVQPAAEPPVKPSSESKDVVEEIFNPKTQPELTEISINNKKPAQPLIVWAIIVVVVAVITGGVLMLITKSPKLNSIVAVKPTPTEAPTIVQPSSTPAVVLNRGDLSVQVLNGGGKPGAASKMKNFLVDKGYKVANVGNASEYNSTTTDIYVKPDKAAAIDLLQADLKSDYTVGSASATLPSDVSYDARVVVGK
jgi:hypothetical protein